MSTYPLATTQESVSTLKEQSLLNTVTGTPYFMAPEVMEEDGYGRKVRPLPHRTTH